MKKTVLASLLVCLGAVCGEAQSLAYFNVITNLNPVGYWPMHEVATAAPGDIETNHGSLGALANGYYPDWAVAANGNRIKRGVPGALANDSDTAVYFTLAGNTPAGILTNVLIVPRHSSLTALNPPFSVECWVYPTNQANQSVWSSSGYEGLNAGGMGNAAGAVGGITLQWNGTNIGFQVYNYFNSSVLLTEGHSGNTNNPNNTPLNQWYHVVVTCDANTNINLYVNGNEGLYQVVGGFDNQGPYTDVPAVGLYTPDYWSPLQIGGGRGGTRNFGGYVDEFAVYTNVLGDVSTHYNDGIGGAAGAYFRDVTNDCPVIYLRMDAPSIYTKPDISTWPVLINYGTTNGVAVENGVYSPGTTPGVITDPPRNPNGVPLAGVPATLAALSGVSSFADAGYAAAYNPIGPVPFSVTALFRGNPCDGRINSIVGHSDNSWNLMINNTGHVFWRFGTNSAANPTSAGVYNDGNWHQVVAVYTPASDPNAAGTNALYIDGALEAMTTNASTNGFGPGSPLDVLIGADPQYTNNPPGVGRQFAGQICDVAIFNQALSADQVQSLYSTLGVAPFITAQPVSDRAVNGGAGTYIYFGVAAKGSAPLAYQWYFNTSSNYSGAIELVDGSKYTNSGTAQVTVTNLTAADSGYYFVVITNNYGSVTSALASLTVYAAPTVVSQFPVPYTNLFTLYAGANPTFSVSANGALPLYYRWFTNGALNAAADGSRFVWSNVSAGPISSYCIVSNVAGAVTSAVWTASVIAAPDAPYPTNVLAANPIGYWRLNEPDDGLGDGNPGVIASDYVGGNNGIYTNVLLGMPGYSPGTDPNDTSATFEYGSIPFKNNYVGQIQGINFATPGGSNAEFTVEAWANGVNSGSFPQAVGAPLATKGIFNLDDQFNLGVDATKTHYRFYVRDASGAVHVVTSGASALDNNWHHIVGVCDEANGQLLLYFDGRLVNAAVIPTNSGIYATPEPMTIGAGTVDGVNYTNQFIGSINDVVVYNYALGFNQVAVQYQSVVPATDAPYFLTSFPTQVTLNAGNTLSLAAKVAGATPLGYYWTDLDTGTVLSVGATNGVPLQATLTISNVPLSLNNGQLTLTVTNAYGTNSLTVLLTVLGPPQIVSDLPPHISLFSGTYTYSIGVNGVPPYNYQWYNGSTPMVGETNTTYFAAAGSPGSSTTYFAVVTNIYGAATSSVSTFSTLASPTNAYAAAVQQFGPVAYWPMHEAEAAALGDMETNYGSLGVAGAGFYADWAANNGNPGNSLIVHKIPGALTNDPDTAVSFIGGASPAYLLVPRTSPALVLNPPFSIECWANPSTAKFGDIVGDRGATLNGGGKDGVKNGVSLSYEGALTPPVFSTWVGSGDGQNEILASFASETNLWHHLVLSCDADTNFVLYVDGVVAASVALPYAPSPCNPWTIGAGFWGDKSGNDPARFFVGSVDEVAIYTNVLPAADVETHYSYGISGAPGQYFAAVLNDGPIVYLRMDSPTYNPPVGNLPALANLGSIPGNGFYSQGTLPGGTGAPTNVPFIPNNAMPGNGTSAFADAGFDPAFNPTGTSQALSLTAWFKGNPADPRFQTLIGHSDRSWRMAMTVAGKLQFAVGSDTALNSIGVYNDGDWHQFVAVYDGVGGREYLYVDGALDNLAALTPGYSIPGTNLDVFIGGDPQYTNSPVGVGRQFSGDLCEVAFFTNALTAAQAQAIYTATLLTTVNTNAAPIVFSVSSNQLTLSWPSDHTGWRLQAQTNDLSAGLGTNWVDVPGSTNVNQEVITINPTSGSVFYRLVYP